MVELIVISFMVTLYVLVLGISCIEVSREAIENILNKK